MKTIKKFNMSAVSPRVQDWEIIDWNKINEYVKKLRQRIFRAEQFGLKRKARKLQRLMIRSRANLLLSIKRVTQINKGKKTAGVDGFTVLTDGERVKLFRKMADYQISLHHPQPSHRTYIKKKNGKYKRKLNLCNLRN